MEKKVIEIDVNVQGANEGFDQLEKKSQSAKARLKELKKELLTLDEGSAEFQKLANEAGELQDRIGDLNNTVKNLGSDTAGLDAIMGGMQAVTGAMAVGQGAVGLFGGENEALEKSLMKVQSAMAMVQGVTAITTALQKDSALMTKLGTLYNFLFAGSASASATATTAQATATGGATIAMRIFNAVVKANPIGVLVTLILAGVAALTAFGSTSETSQEQVDSLTGAIERQNKAMDKSLASMQGRNAHELEMMKLKGATEEQIFNKKISNIEEEQDKREKIQVKRKESYERLAKELKKAQNDENWELAKTISDKIALEKDGIDKIKADRVKARQDKEVELATERNRIKNDALEDEKQKAKDLKDANDKAREERRKRAEERKNDLRKAQDIENSLIKNDVEKKIAIEQTRYNREIENFKGSARLKEALKKQHEDNLLAIETESLAKIKAVIDKAESDANAKKQADNEKQLAESKARAEYRRTERQALELENAELVSKDFITKEEAAKRLADFDEKARRDKLSAELHAYDLHMEATKGLLQGIADLTSAFAGKSRQAQEKAFKVQKGLNIAMALIDTYKGATSAFTGMITTVPGPVGIALGVVAAAGVVASGIANIKKISATKFDGGGASASGGAPTGVGGSIGGGGGTTAPNFTIAGASGVNQLNQSVQGQQPVKAYVVSAEVSTAQSLDRNAIKNATL